MTILAPQQMGIGLAEACNAPVGEGDGHVILTPPSHVLAKVVLRIPLVPLGIMVLFEWSVPDNLQPSQSCQ